MKQALFLVQDILAVILIVLIMLQTKGMGLGSIGGSMNFYSTRRGAEKAVFVLTIIVSIAFFGVSLLGVVL